MCLQLHDEETTTATNNLGVVADGKRTITVTDQVGHVLTNRVYDIVSGLLISQDIIVQMAFLHLHPGRHVEHPHLGTRTGHHLRL